MELENPSFFLDPQNSIWPLVIELYSNGDPFTFVRLCHRYSGDKSMVAVNDIVILTTKLVPSYINAHQVELDANNWTEAGSNVSRRVSKPNEPVNIVSILSKFTKFLRYVGNGKECEIDALGTQVTRSSKLGRDSQLWIEFADLEFKQPHTNFYVNIRALIWKVLTQTVIGKPENWQMRYKKTIAPPNKPFLDATVSDNVIFQAQKYNIEPDIYRATLRSSPEVNSRVRTVLIAFLAKYAQWYGYIQPMTDVLTVVCECIIGDHGLLDSVAPTMNMVVDMFSDNEKYIWHDCFYVFEKIMEQFQHVTVALSPTGVFATDHSASNIAVQCENILKILSLYDSEVYQHFVSAAARERLETWNIGNLFADVFLTMFSRFRNENCKYIFFDYLLSALISEGPDMLFHLCHCCAALVIVYRKTLLQLRDYDKIQSFIRDDCKKTITANAALQITRLSTELVEFSANKKLETHTEDFEKIIRKIKLYDN